MKQLTDFVLGPPAAGSLPDAAHLSLQSDRRSSELLVCVTQFAAIAFFGGFYAITPKAFPPDVAFEPVPLALALYTVFTLGRLVLVLLDRLSNWFIGLSVVVDISVLMITIWSFHLQYQQPPTVYLKAPTLLYAFILIALRTLRHEPRWIVLAGATTLVGWTALVTFAVVMSPGVRVTRSFAEYASSGAVLIGAEVDKLLSFAAVTAVLTVASIRSRRLLLRATTETHVAAEFSKFFSPNVASDIRARPDRSKPGDAVLREASVMMIDIRGFTSLASSLPPQQVLFLIEQFQNRMVPVIRSCGGEVDKYMGDGIVATFGAARASETFAADALCALRSVVEESRSWSAERIKNNEPPVSIGCSVATGPMLCGVVGVADRMEWTIIGEAANLAAKLEKHCKVVGVAALTTQATLDRADAQGMSTEGWIPLPGHEVAGVNHTLDLAAPPDSRT